MAIIVDTLDPLPYTYAFSLWWEMLWCAPDLCRPDGGSLHAEHLLLPTVRISAPAIYPYTTQVLSEAPTPDTHLSPPVGGTFPDSVCAGKRLILSPPNRH